MSSSPGRGAHLRNLMMLLHLKGLSLMSAMTSSGS